MMSGGPIAVFNHYLWPAIINNFGKGDSADGFIYNNAEAAGKQLYPVHMAKYWDLYSWDGYFKFVGDWFLITLYVMAGNYTILPINVWLAIFDGKSLEGFWKYYVWYFDFSLIFKLNETLASLLNVTVEDGWPIL